MKPFTPQSRCGMTKLEALSVVAVIVLLVAMAIPNFVKARWTHAKDSCPDYNLPGLEKAKSEWAKKFQKKVGDVPQMTDLLPFLPRNQPGLCPAGGTYTIGAVGEKPRCSDAYHTARFLEGK